MNLRIRMAPELDDAPQAYYVRRYLVAVGRLLARDLTVTVQNLEGTLAVSESVARRALTRARATLQGASADAARAVRMELRA